jgi:DNA-binding NtrC family response regulator
MSAQIAKFNRTILIIEDDISQLGRYLEMAREAGFDASGALSYEQALTHLSNASFNYVLTDIHLGGQINYQGYEGLKILRYLRENMPEVIPLAMTSDPKIQTYHEVLKEGVEHLFRKPIISKDELLIHLNAARNRHMVRRLLKRRPQNAGFSERILEKYPDGIVVSDTIRETVRKVAAHGRVPVVIYGETGTGKEEIAKLIHRRRVDISGAIPFVPVNCANLQNETAISALFGHKKGAFTGATETTIGYVGEANGGILFLDEIHALTPECQQRLLRVLNDGSYSRLGDPKELHSDFQVIVASTRNLDEEIDQGRFLLDLGNRLLGLDISLNPLRERKEDLPVLIELFFARNGLNVPPEEIERIAKRCGEFYWRGNIRQLLQVLQSWIVQAECNEQEIRAENLPVFKLMMAPGDDSGVARNLGLEGIPADAGKFIERALKADQPLDETVDRFEKLVLQAAMTRHSKLVDLAKALGLGRSTLNEKRRRYGI